MLITVFSTCIAYLGLAKACFVVGAKMLGIIIILAQHISVQIFLNLKHKIQSKRSSQHYRIKGPEVHRDCIRDGLRSFNLDKLKQ